MDHSEEKDMEGAGEAEVFLQLESNCDSLYQGGASAQRGVVLPKHRGGNNPRRRYPGREQRATPGGRSPCWKSTPPNHLPLLSLLRQVSPLPPPRLNQILSREQQHVQGPAVRGLGGDAS